MVSAVAGTAGVGKTALAVRWAHRVRDTFPAGQLYVNLRGYDPGEPLAAADALAGFLRALGLAGQDVPADTAERAARYRSLLDGRRMLILLDNASSVEQVRPLLPGTSSCFVVVTSRDSLAGLVARDGAQRLDLDPMPPAEAITLLRVLIGARVRADLTSAATLAAQCARLPLALRVAAEYAVSRPALTLAQLTTELAAERRRLDLLDAGGDPRTAVRAVFSWSYRHLPPAVARAFRLAGLHPAPDLGLGAAAALFDTSAGQAGELLGQLRGAHLVHPCGAGRYGMHDLLRAYSAHLTNAPQERTRALTRLLDYYLAASASAADVLFPAERHRRPLVPRVPPAGPHLSGPAEARTWLDNERTAVQAVVSHAAGHGWPRHAVLLSALVARYLETGGHYTEAVTIHTQARRAARQAGDRGGEAHALNNLGIVSGRLGRYAEGACYLRRSLALFRETGDHVGAARPWAILGRATGARAGTSRPPATTRSRWPCSVRSGMSWARPGPSTASAWSACGWASTGRPPAISGPPWPCIRGSAIRPTRPTRWATSGWLTCGWAAIRRPGRTWSWPWPYRAASATAAGRPAP
jgi:tetratricopeptide (TPR) repeat protein